MSEERLEFWMESVVCPALFFGLVAAGWYFLGFERLIFVCIAVIPGLVLAGALLYGAAGLLWSLGRFIVRPWRDSAPR